MVVPGTSSIVFSEQSACVARKWYNLPLFVVIFIAVYISHHALKFNHTLDRQASLVP